MFTYKIKILAAMFLLTAALLGVNAATSNVFAIELEGTGGTNGGSGTTNSVDYKGPALCTSATLDSVVTKQCSPNDVFAPAGGFKENTCYSLGNNGYEEYSCTSGTTDEFCANSENVGNCSEVNTYNSSRTQTQTQKGDPDFNLASGEGRCGSTTIDPENCDILKWVRDIINVMSAVVGIVIAIMFAVRGIQYMTARDNAQQVTQAKGQFFWLIIALVVYLFSFSFLQWLVPGGIF